MTQQVFDVEYQGSPLIPVAVGTATSVDLPIELEAVAVYLSFYNTAGAQVTPTAGLLTVYRRDAFGGYSEFGQIQAADCGTTPIYVAPTFNGLCDKIQVVQSGVSGADYLRVRVFKWDGQADKAGQIALAKIIDGSGKEAMNTVFGELTVGQRSDAVNVQFQYRVSTIDTITTTSGTGAVTHTQGIASIESGAGVGSARLESKATIRYIPGHESIINFTADFSPTQSGVVQRAGSFDTQNGAYFKDDGVNFGVAVLKGGVETFITAANFNGTRLSFDRTHYNIYQITYGWLGIAPINFYVYGGTERGWILLHSYDLTGVAEGPHMLDPTLPVAIQVDRASGIGTNVVIKTSSWRAGVIGNVPIGTLIDHQWTRFVSQKAVSANTLTPLISLKVRTTFNGLTNHVRLRYGTVALACDGTKPVQWFVYRNGTLTGAVFADQDTNESVTQYDVTASAITGGALVGGTLTQKAADTRINLFSGDVVIAAYPGETITLCAQSTGATTVDVFLRWIEEF